MCPNLKVLSGEMSLLWMKGYTPNFRFTMQTFIKKFVNGFFLKLLKEFCPRRSMNEILEYITGYIEFSDILSTSNSQVLLDSSGPHYLQFHPQLSVHTKFFQYG
jgi:hypothetical protein